ncbi:MAG: hypothetical protein H8D23_16135 [Candidatus Brocadiales bacterium]|nr:hypothetical protein [Candidatus Brocadiales bacterium]
MRNTKNRKPLRRITPRTTPKAIASKISGATVLRMDIASDISIFFVIC